MKRKIKLVLVFSILCTMAYSQDILTLKNGEQSVVKIESVSDDTIVYRLWSNQNGPIRTTSIKKVKSIQYANGQKETFLDEWEKDQEEQKIKDSLGRVNFIPKLVVGVYAGPQLCQTAIHAPCDYSDKTYGYRFSPTFGVNALLDLTYYTTLYGGLGYSIEGGHFEDYNNQEYRCNYVTLDTGICIFERSCIIALRTAFLTNGSGYENDVKICGKESYSPVRFGLYYSLRKELGSKKQHGIELYSCFSFTDVLSPDNWKSGETTRTSNEVWGIKYTYHFISKELKKK